MSGFFKNDEKKVEYIELIYDLIFVYIIGRNNSLINHITDGFIDTGTFITYFLCTLITIQIWYSTTIFINRYGTNSISEYIGLFINMYLLYYMADGVRIHWQDYYYRYNIAWLLILLNIAFQYYLKYRKTKKEEPWKTASIKHYILMLIIQALIIAVCLALYPVTGLPAAPVAMIIGMILAIINKDKADLISVDFTHLTERVMLYIVFTFGEMIIAVASYFSGEINLNNIFFSSMAFLIVIGLFTSYGFLYDRLLAREMPVSGNSYIIIHIFIIFALSNLTNAFEFMREPQINALPKNIYLVSSFAVYYIFLFMTAPFTKGYKKGKRYFPQYAVTVAFFIIIMMVFYRNPYISIIASALMSFSVCFLEYRYYKKVIAV